MTQHARHGRSDMPQQWLKFAGLGVALLMASMLGSTSSAAQAPPQAVLKTVELIDDGPIGVPEPLQPLPQPAAITPELQQFRIPQKPSRPIELVDARAQIEEFPDEAVQDVPAPNKLWLPHPVHSSAYPPEGDAATANYQPILPVPSTPLPTEIQQIQTGQDQGGRRLRAFPRSSQPFATDSFRTPEGEQVVVLSGGVNLLVDDVSTGEVLRIEADRAVLWTRLDNIGGLGGNNGEGGTGAARDTPLEVYLEGNLYVYAGNPRKPADTTSSVISGRQAYFNINTSQGLILDGFVETYDREYQLPLFLRAREIRQLSGDRFYATDAGVTTSPYRGVPGYEFTADEMLFEQTKRNIVNPFTKQQVIDPATNEPLIRTQYFATGYDNFFRLHNVPFFYWPYMRVDVEDPLGPVERMEFGHSNNLGFKAGVTLDIWDLIGLDYLPIADQTNWYFDVAGMSSRGVSLGTRFNYFNTDSLLLRDGNGFGNVLAWGILDGGNDVLSRTGARSWIDPPNDLRGRARFQHREDAGPWTFIAETSYLSDANVLESFFEGEYDTGKNQETLAYGKYQADQWAGTLLVQPKLHDFLSHSGWLPRADFYGLALPLGDLSDTITYTTRSNIGYALMRPNDQVQFFPGSAPAPVLIDTDMETGRFDTRHELSLPFSLGALRLAPYVIGQATAYTETLTDEDGALRLYGATGIRGTLPFWKVYPGVRSLLFNVNGIAHKVSLNADYMIAGSNQNYQDLPYLDLVDDDASDITRRRFLQQSWIAPMAFRGDGTINPLFDARYFALQRGVTYNTDILDDLHVGRFSVTNRLQTKRGPVGKQSIIDWMLLDLGATLFPADARDNFGDTLGFVDAYYEWNLGDRTSLYSTINYRPADERLAALGQIVIQRPPRSAFSLFVNSFSTDSSDFTFIGASTSYRFSEKYAAAFSIGQSIDDASATSYTCEISRVGLDFVTTLGFVFNSGRDDFGLQFSILPRALPQATVGRGQVSSLPFGTETGPGIYQQTRDRLGSVDSFSVN